MCSYVDSRDGLVAVRLISSRALYRCFVEKEETDPFRALADGKRGKWWLAAARAGAHSSCPSIRVAVLCAVLGLDGLNAVC